MTQSNGKGELETYSDRVAREALDCGLIFKLRCEQ